MKSLKYWLISLSFFLSPKVFSCTTPSYTPGEYYVFYSFDEMQVNRAYDVDEANFSEWRLFTGNKASVKDIEEVVNGYPLESLDNILTNKNDKNTFAVWIRKNNGLEVVRYLLLAKRCELARAERADKWWYSSKEDLEYSNLREIIKEAIAYKGSRLKSRYLLQAVRAAYTMKDYDFCLNLWTTEIKHMPSSAVKIMCQGYICGIWFRKGDYAKAIECYTSARDKDSFWWCARYLTKEYSDLERIKILYKYQPKSNELAKMVQMVCRDAEDCANYSVFNGKDQGYGGAKAYRENRKRYIGLRNFALQVASEKRSDNPALWQYAAAFLTFIDGEANLAVTYAQKAAKLQGTPFIKEKIQMLQILLDACVTPVCDVAFETAFLPKLQYLDSLICRDINTKNKKKYWDDNVLTSIKKSYNDYMTIYNYSQYYPYDMFRKILLAVLMPKYLKQGDYTKALLFAGAASERLRMLVNFNHNGYSDGYPDYRTDIFNCMDRVPVENVIKYKQLILQPDGINDFESFLALRCYKNKDYLNEIIGTKYLRKEQFDKAIEYFALVSDKYIKKMALYEYFHLEPFRKIYNKREIETPYPSYKLNYAKRMLSLQIKMQTNDKESRAEAALQYALALKRSFACGESWALTCYYLRCWDDDWIDESCFRTMKKDDWKEKLLKSSGKYLKQAERMSKNQEIKAQCYIAEYSSFDVFKPTKYDSFIKEYSGSRTLKEFCSECDAFNSYYASSIDKHIKTAWEYNLKKKC